MESCDLASGPHLGGTGGKGKIASSPMNDCLADVRLARGDGSSLFRIADVSEAKGIYLTHQKKPAARLCRSSNEDKYPVEFLAFPASILSTLLGRLFAAPAFWK